MSIFDPVVEFGKKVGQEAYEWGYSIGREISGQPPPPHYPKGEYQDTTPPAEYVEPYKPSKEPYKPPPPTPKGELPKPPKYDEPIKEKPKPPPPPPPPPKAITAIATILKPFTTPLATGRKIKEVAGAVKLKTFDVFTGTSPAGRAVEELGREYDVKVTEYKEEEVKLEEKWEPYTPTDKDFVSTPLAVPTIPTKPKKITEVKAVSTFVTPERTKFEEKWASKIKDGRWIGTEAEYETFKREEVTVRKIGQQKFAEYQAGYAGLEEKYKDLDVQYQQIEHLQTIAEKEYEERLFGVPKKWDIAEVKAAKRVKKHIPSPEAVMAPAMTPEIVAKQKETYEQYRRLFGLAPEPYEWEKKIAIPEAEFKIGMVEGVREKPLKTTASAAAFFLLPTVLKGAKVVGVATKVAPKAVGGILPEAAKYIPTVAGVGLGVLYGKSIIERVKFEPPELRARKAGEIVSTELFPMAIGGYAGMKIPEIVPYKIHVGKPPSRLLIEAGKVPIYKAPPEIKPKALSIIEEGLMQERYVAFLGEPKLTTVRYKPLDVTLKKGRLVEVKAPEPIKIDVAPMYVRPPAKEVPRILTEFGFEGKPKYVSTPYGEYIAVGAPTRIPVPTQKLIPGYVPPTRISRTYPIWVSKKLDISPFKFEMVPRVPTRLAIPEFAPDITVTPRVPYKYTTVVPPAKDIVPFREYISGKYPEYTAIVGRPPAKYLPPALVDWKGFVAGLKTPPIMPVVPKIKIVVPKVGVKPKITVEDILHEAGIKPKATKKCPWCLPTEQLGVPKVREDFYLEFSKDIGLVPSKKVAVKPKLRPVKVKVVEPLDVKVKVAAPLGIKVKAKMPFDLDKVVLPEVKEVPFKETITVKPPKDKRKKKAKKPKDTFKGFFEPGIFEEYELKDLFAGKPTKEPRPGDRRRERPVILPGRKPAPIFEPVPRPPPRSISEPFFEVPTPVPWTVPAPIPEPIPETWTFPVPPPPYTPKPVEPIEPPIPPPPAFLYAPKKPEVDKKKKKVFEEVYRERKYEILTPEQILKL